MEPRNRYRGPYRIGDALRALTEYRRWREVRAVWECDGTTKIVAHCFQGHEVELDEYGRGLCSCGETIRRYKP